MKLSDIKINDKKQVVLTLTGVQIAFSGNGKNHFVANDFEGKLRHDFNCILDDKHVKAVDKAIKLVAEAQGIDLSELTSKQKPLRDGNKNKNKTTGEIYNGFEGKMYLSVIRHARSAKGDTIKPAVIYGGDKQVLTNPTDPRVKEDGCFANVQVVLYGNKQYSTISCSYDFLAFRNDPYEPFGGGATVENEGDLFDGTEEGEEGEDEI